MTDTTKTVVLNENNFQAEVLGSDRPVLVDFWAAWCGPCRAIAPTLEQLAGEYEGTVTIGKLNVDENPGLARRYGVQAIPTMLLFRDGQVIDQIVGAVPKPMLAQKLQAALQPV